MAKQKIDFEAHSRINDEKSPGFVMVVPKEDNKFLIVIKLYLVTTARLSKFFRLLQEAGFTSRIPHDTERKQGEPLFVKFVLTGRTVEKDFTFLVECLVQSGLLKTVVVCEMDKY